MLVGVLAKAQKYPVRYYNVNDGLAHTQVTHIFQDSKGHLWLSTPGGGVSCFNGSKFKNYGTDKGLSNLVARACTEDAEGRILIGTMGGGLFILSHDTIVPFKDTALNKDIFWLHTGKDGTTWIGTSVGLFTLKKNKVENFTQKNKLPGYAVTYIDEDAEGNTWFNYDAMFGLYKVKGTKLQHFDSANGLTNGRILSTFHDKAGRTWIATYEGVYEIEKGKASAKKIAIKGLPDAYVFGFIEIGDELYMGTQSYGVFVFNRVTGETRNIGSKNGLKGDLVLRLFKDRENNVWLSNWGDGIARLMLTGFMQYDDKSGIPNRLVYLHRNNYIGTSKGAYTLQDGKWVHQFPAIEEPIVCIFSDEQATFLGSDNTLYTVKGNQSEKLRIPPGFSPKGITRSGDGKMYFSSWGGGIFTLENHTVVPVNDSIASEGFFYCAFTDSKGRSWFGSYGSGLVFYDGHTWKRMTEKDGLPSGIVTCITEDKNGTIWVGTNGAGIALLNPQLKVFHVFTEKTGLKTNSILSMAGGPGRKIWVGQVGGIDAVSIPENPSGEYTIQHYGSDQGFTGDCLYNGMDTDAAGNLWIGTNNFLWRYNEKEKSEVLSNLSIYLSEVLSDYRHFDFSREGANQFPYNKNRITFRFFSTNISRNQELKYKYRLKGIDTDWSPLTEQTEITFHDLRPGNYEFEVVACLGSDCSDVPATYAFTIHPPYWQTWWFRITVLVVLTGIIWIVFRWRTAQLRRNKLELELQVRERTREIKQQKDEIQLQKEIVEEKNREILDSIAYAKRLQEAILPPEKLWLRYLPQSFILYKPKDIVAGDFYFMEHTGKHLIFAAADCTGHGVPGAMVSVVCSNALSRAVKEFNLTDPGKILDKVCELVIETFEKSESEVKDGMDISLCSLDTHNNRLSWAGANNSLWILRKGAAEITEIKADKQPIGKSEKTNLFTTHTLSLQAGDTLYIFTDGFEDQFGGSKGKKFKASKVKELLISIKDQSPQEQKTSVNRAFESWRGHLEQVDDVCVIGIKI